MSRVPAEFRHPVALGFAAYACAHVALFSLIGLLGLSMPALLWGLGGLLLAWAASGWMLRYGHEKLADLLAIQSVALAGGVVGMHGRQLYCVFAAMI